MKKKYLDHSRFWQIMIRLKLQRFYHYLWRQETFRRFLNLRRELLFWRMKKNPHIYQIETTEFVKSISKDLKSYGYALAHVANLREEFNVESLQRDFQNLSRVGEKVALPNEAKTYIDRIVQDDIEISSIAPNLYQLILNSELASVAAHYFGLTPTLTSFKLWRSHSNKGLAGRVASQNWHRDFNEFRMLRVFVYFNDVSLKTGAGQYIRGSHYAGDSYNLLQYSEESGTYATEEEVSNFFTPDRIVTAEGSAGTLVFMDTAGLHRGGYHLVESERLVALITYSTGADLVPCLTPLNLAAWSQLPKFMREVIRAA
jgi:hypothetical protein